jgi:predicted nucleotidyltransferase component of viral defense system
LSILYAAENAWFTGEAVIPTCSREEMLATKMRGLLQREKGRDLLDLSHALAVFDELDAGCVIEIFRRYLAQQKLKLSRAQAEERMFAKLTTPEFLVDIRPLLAPTADERLTDETMKTAFADVFTGFVTRLPGNPPSGVFITPTSSGNYCVRIV